MCGPPTTLNPMNEASRKIRSPFLRRKCLLFALGLAGGAPACFAQIIPPPDSIHVGTDAGSDAKWLDRTQSGLYRFIWKSARSIDRLGGAPATDEQYQEASGYTALAMMWSEYDGWDPRVRFNVDLPLPRVNKRFKAFIGRVNRDEYVFERVEPSGAFPRVSRSIEEDETLAGIAYSQTPREGGRFSASGGARLRGGLDPYVKASYIVEWLPWEDTVLRLKESVIWQKSERLGLTSRLDFDRMFGRRWHMRWTGSGTVTQETPGLRGYSTLTFTRPLPNRQAIILQASFNVDTTEDVKLRDYGVKFAYRRSVFRDWLVMETRTSLSWPRESLDESRKPSWGVGIGVQMYFGNEEFTGRPITF